MRYLWVDHDGNTYVVVKTGEKIASYWGDKYVAIKVVGEDGYHTAIVNYAALTAA